VGWNRKVRLPATILLVDPDLGFVFWLGQALESAGYTALPASNARAAIKLVREHKLSVDILVIDPSLPDVLALISALRKSRRTLKVVASIPEDSKELPDMTEVDAFVRKPHRFTKVAMIPWLNAILNLPTGARPGLQKSKLRQPQ
jgi:DNA-binding response OmpR family regulator